MRQEAIIALDSKISDKVPNPLISVLAQRSQPYIACLVAISMLGYGIGPVDEQWPALRIRQAIRIMRPVLLVILSPGNPSEVHDTLAYAAQLNIRVCQISFSRLTDAKNDSAPSVCSPRGAISYCIFTSGSSEAPKGCLGTWRALGCRCTWYQEQVLPKIEPSRKYCPYQTFASALKL